jgi:hypothetical protein
MATFNPLFTRTVRAAGAIARGRGVGFDGAQIAAVNAKPLGIAPHAAVAGDDTPVVVSGTAICEAGGSFALGAALAMDAQGRVVAAAALAVATGATAMTSAAANGVNAITGGEPPHYVVGDAMQASTGAGQFVEVLLRR